MKIKKILKTHIFLSVDYLGFNQYFCLNFMSIEMYSVKKQLFYTYFTQYQLIYFEDSIDNSNEKNKSSHKDKILLDSNMWKIPVDEHKEDLIHIFLYSWPKREELKKKTVSILTDHYCKRECPMGKNRDTNQPTGVSQISNFLRDFVWYLIFLICTGSLALSLK